MKVNEWQKAAYAVHWSGMDGIKAIPAMEACWFNLLYHEKRMEAILELEGVGAGYGWGMEEKMGRLYVIDKTKLTNKWATYVQNEADPKLVPLKNIPAIFLSEMLAAVEKIKPYEQKGTDP